jgi:lysozyme family protein
VSRFDECLDFVLKWEGGYVHHPHDRGGATNKGITQAAYDDYRVGRGLGRQPVSGLSRVERDDIYRTRYWSAVRGDDLPAPLDLVVFDSAVNAGPAQAIKWLQRAVGAAVDGKIGPVTLAAVKAADPKQAAMQVIDQRLDFYEYLAQRDKKQAVFLAGWTNRVNGLKPEVV